MPFLQSNILVESCQWLWEILHLLGKNSGQAEKRGHNQRNPERSQILWYMP